MSTQSTSNHGTKRYYTVNHKKMTSFCFNYGTLERCPRDCD